MRWLHYLIYGFMCGFAELVPASGEAHQYILGYVFGIDHLPFLDLLVHSAVLAALIVGNFPVLSRLRRDKRLYRKKRLYDMRGIYDVRLTKTATFLMVLGYLVYTFVDRLQASLVLLLITSSISAVILLIADHMRQGNKHSGNISSLNAIGIGLGCALSAIPGISRVGMTLSISSAVGADRTNAYNWSLLISIPAIVIIMCFDFIALFTVGFGTVTFLILLSYLLSALAAFAGSYAAITFMRYLCVKNGFSGIAYYNIGVAIFSFILYLIT